MSGTSEDSIAFYSCIQKSDKKNYKKAVRLICESLNKDFNESYVKADLIKVFLRHDYHPNIRGHYRNASIHYGDFHMIFLDIENPVSLKLIRMMRKMPLSGFYANITDGRNLKPIFKVVDDSHADELAKRTFKESGAINISYDFENSIYNTMSVESVCGDKHEMRYSSMSEDTVIKLKEEMCKLFKRYFKSKSKRS